MAFSIPSGSSLTSAFDVVLCQQGNDCSEFIPLRLREVRFLILSVNGQQEHRNRFAAKIVDHPHAPALSLAPGCPSKLPYAARFGDHITGLGVRGDEYNQPFPLLVGYQTSRLPKKERRQIGRA